MTVWAVHIHFVSAQDKTADQGVYTSAQAARGAAVFEAHCVSCHREGGSAPVLAGARFTKAFADATLLSVFTTIQTTMYRLETKRAIKRTRKISNAHIFEAVLSRTAAHRRIVDELLALFGGRTQPVMSHLIEAGKLTLDDLRDAEKAIRKHSAKERAK